MGKLFSIHAIRGLRGAFRNVTPPISENPVIILHNNNNNNNKNGNNNNNRNRDDDDNDNNNINPLPLNTAMQFCEVRSSH